MLNTWTSSGEPVIVRWPDGTPRRAIPVPGVVGDPCVGGPDGSDVFVAAATSPDRVATTTRWAAEVDR